MAAGLDIRNKDGDSFEFSSYKNVRIIGTYTTPASKSSSSSAQPTLSSTIDLRDTLPSNFTFDSTVHKFFISKLKPTSVTAECPGTYSFNTTVTSQGFGVVVADSGDSLGSSTQQVPFPTFSIADDGYTLTITSESVQVSANQCPNSSAFCPALNDRLDELVEAGTIDSYVVNSCNATSTDNTSNYYYENCDYLLILSEAD